MLEVIFNDFIFLLLQSWELMNTAVLTGRQVAQAMKVFMVSQGGKVADVTLKSSCYAEDESVIKVCLYLCQYVEVNYVKYLQFC